MPLTRGCRAKCRTVATRMGAPARVRNCFGVLRLRRAPTPPAGMTTATSRTARSRAIFVAQAREDHAPGGRLEHAGDDDVGGLAEIAPAMVDDDHRAVVEVGDALPGFLSLTHDLYTHRLAGQDDRLQRVGQLVDVEHGYAAELGHLVEVVIV